MSQSAGSPQAFWIKVEENGRKLEAHMGRPQGRGRRGRTDGPVGAGYRTCLAELRSALALARHAHHGLHFGTNAGAPLLVVSAYCTDRRV